MRELLLLVKIHIIGMFPIWLYFAVQELLFLFLILAFFAMLSMLL